MTYAYGFSVRKRKMNYENFLHIVPENEKSRVKEATLKLWHSIFYYILQNGNADIVDDDAFIEHITSEKEVSKQTIARHLNRMSKCGLIEAHTLRRKADQETLDLARMSWPHSDPLPTSFKRYTLPGTKSSLKMKKGDKLWNDMIGNLRKSDLKEEIRKFGFNL